jgi:sarcosine oxidase subunit beta
MTVGSPTTHLVGELPRSADLIVIGGGVVGAATAFFAGRAGLKTLLLEARPALATLTTPVSTGAFRLQFDNPEEIALVREGVDLFHAFAEVTGLAGYDIGLRPQGYLFCTTTEAGVARQRRWVEAQHGWGLTDVELLTGEEARYRFPYLSPTVRQARYRAGDGFLDPVRLTHWLRAASGARSAGDTGDLAWCRRWARRQRPDAASPRAPRSSSPPAPSQREGPGR